MNVKILASGSKGNAVVINDTVLIDAGISIKAFESHNLSEIDTLIVTHKHADHMKTPLVRKLIEDGIQTYLPSNAIADLTEEGKLDLNPFLASGKLKVLNHSTTIKTDHLTITPYPQKHHTLVNYALVIENSEHRLLYATDLDNLGPTDLGVGLLSLGMFDTILLEGNYDEVYLRDYIEHMVSLVPGDTSPDLFNNEELEAWVRANYRHLPKDVASNAFRAVQNYRHLSKQQARAYVVTHLNPGGRYYELHRSSQFYQAPDGWYED